MSKRLFVGINKNIEIDLEDDDIINIIEEYGEFNEDNAFKYCRGQIEDELLVTLDHRYKHYVWVD